MLQPAWYLADVDFFADLAHSPRNDNLRDLVSAAHHRFGDDAGHSPSHTAAATHLALIMAEHLGQAVQRPGISIGDRRELARLLAGLNLLTAHLAQATATLAGNLADGRAPAITTGDPAHIDAVCRQLRACSREHLEHAAAILAAARAALPSPDSHRATS